MRGYMGVEECEYAERIEPRSFMRPLFLFLMLIGSLSATVWWNVTWTYSIPININTTVTSNLTNFPALVMFNTTNDTLWNTSTCANVRFTDAANTTILNYEIRDLSFCNNSTTLTAFYVGVNTTNSSESNTTIYAYLGNINAISGENKASVWNNANYVSVYHMTTNVSLNDSTGRNNLTIATGKAVDCRLITTGQFGKSINFTTGKCAYNTTLATGLAVVAGNSTESVLHKTHVFDDFYYPILGYGNISSAMGNQRNLYIRFQSINHIHYSYSSSSWNTGVDTPLDVWAYSAISYNGTHAFAYTNGSAIANSAFAFVTPSTSVLTVGTYPYGDYSQVWKGELAELRLRNATSTTDWLIAENSQTAVNNNIITNNYKSGNLTVSAINGTALGNQTDASLPSNYSITSEPLTSSFPSLYNFVSWNTTGNCSINAQTINTTVEVRDNCNATAYYVYVPVYYGQLLVTCAAGGASCGNNTSILAVPFVGNLSYVANTNYSFRYWVISGGCSEINATNLNVYGGICYATAHFKYFANHTTYTALDPHVTGTISLLGFMNTITGGMFGIGIILALGIIIFMSLFDRGFEEALMAAAVFSTLICILGAWMNMVSPLWIVLFLAITCVAIILLSKKRG